MESEYNRELLIRVEDWCIRNTPFKGKMKIIGEMADDLRLPTFEYKQPHWKVGYPHNTEIAKCLNELGRQGKIVINRSGRSHVVIYVSGNND